MPENTPRELLAFSAVFIARVDGGAFRGYVVIRLLAPEGLSKLPATAEIDRKRANRYAPGILQLATLESMTRTIYVGMILLIFLLRTVIN